MIAKKNIKENWKIKGKIIYQKRDYCKVQIIANQGEIAELKKISTKAINKKICLSFSLIIFLVG